MAYNAFISYSHTADSSLAAALQSTLHRFAKPWYKLRALHIFRDQTNLAVNPALWTSIREALDQSLFFILLASPEAAASPWVAKEAEYWLSRNGPSHVLIVLTGGTLLWDSAASGFTPAQTNALPASLLHSFSEEPLYIDLRWAREKSVRFRLREPRFHEAVLQLASTLHNRPKDELDGVDIRQQRQTRLLAASGLLAILVAGLFALWLTRQNHHVSIENLAANLAANSKSVLAESPDRAREAALLAIESTRLSPSFEGNQALRAAAALLPAASQSYPPEDSNPTERVRDLAFSPDGNLLAVARDDGSTQLLDVQNHKAEGYLTPDEKPAAQIEVPSAAQEASDNNSAVSVAFNASGSQLATGARDGIAHIASLSGGRELLRISNGSPIAQIAFHPTADQVLTASDDGHARIFDVARAVIVADFKCPDKAVSASFSPDGNLVAALSADGVVSLFDLKQRTLVRQFGGGEAGFNLAFSKDGKRLATATGDFASVWEVSTGRQLLKATHAASSETLIPQRWIVDVALSPDGKFLAYAARGDPLARVWNVDTGRQILELKHGSAVAAVAFNADGSKLGTGSYDGTARVWELPSGSELERASHAQGAEVVIFSPNGSRFAAGGMTGSVSVSETRRADRPVSFSLPGDVRSVAFSPDGGRIAIGTVSVHWSPLVRIVETSGKTVRDIEFHGAPVIDKLFFPDSNHVIAQWSNKLFFIDIERASVTLLPEIRGERRMDPSGKVFAIQQDGISKLYTLPGLAQTASLTGPSSGLVRPAAEGRLLAFESSQPPNDFFIDVWNVASKARVSRVRLPAELNHLVLNAAGTLLFTTENENLQVWEIPSGKQCSAFKASDDINVVVPDPASAALATITHGHLTVWDGATGGRLAQLPDAGYLRAAAFSPDGRYLLSGYDGRFAALWLWRSSDLRDQACARLTRNLSREEWAHWFPKQAYRQTCPNLPAEPKNVR
jgi:WD40 repeat protein